MIYLVDASVYIFRAYHAMQADVTDRDGNPSHAVYGFARFLSDLIERVRPERIVVAFDQRRPGCYRSRIYPAYKANRDPQPVDLMLQFRRCFELCQLVGITAIGHAEYEADDIIGSLCSRMRASGIPSTLITRDKDLAQLMREGDVYWDYGSGLQLSYHDIERRFDVAPERFADYLALTGDAVDNIRGVPGIGPKTAAALMKHFACLEDLYEGLSRVGSLKFRGAAQLPAKLLEHRDAAYLARQLTMIVCDMQLDVDDAGLYRRTPNMDALMDFYAEQGFGPMLRQQAQRIAQMPLSRSLSQ